MALFGGAKVILFRFQDIFGHALAQAVKLAKVEKRVGVPLLRRRQPLLQGGRVIAAPIGVGALTNASHGHGHTSHEKHGRHGHSHRLS